MTFCAQCGAAATPGLGFCAACGAHLPAAPDAVAPSAAPARPIGRAIDPWKVVLLAVVTLGVYTYVTWWRTSREVDAYAGSRSHALARVGIVVTALSIVLVVAAIASVTYATMAPILAEDPNAQADPAALQAAYLESPLFLGASAGALAGALLLYAGMWRAWSAMRADELRRGHPRPLQPALFVAILLGAALLSSLSLAYPPLRYVGYAGSIATFWILHAWQTHLNEAWRAAQAAGAW